MQKSFFKFILLSSIVMTITSCSKKTPSEAKYIPKDASNVFVINPKSLDEKLKSGNLSLDSFINRFKTLGDSIDADKLKKWDDFKNSGINLDNNLYFFLVQKGSMQKGLTTAFSVMASLKDEAKFEKFIKEQKEFKAENLTKEKTHSYLSTNEKFSLAWNKEVVVATFYSADKKPLIDSLGNYSEPDNTEENKAQKEEVNRYFNLKETESVASISLFKDMFKTKADGYVFSSTNAFIGYLASTPLNIPKVQELLQDNYSSTTFNFENGKIVVSSNSYTNPMLSSILKKYSSAKVNTHLAEFFPTQNLNGTILISFNPELFDGLLKELEVKGMLDGFLSQQGLTSADLFKVLSGEINVAMSDFNVESKEVTTKLYDGSEYKHNSTVPSFKLIVTAKVGDKAAFTKIMDKAVENKLLAKTTNGYTTTEAMSFTGMYFFADEKTIVIASNQELYTTYLANKQKSNINSNILSEFKGKSLAAYIDINSLINGSLKSIKDSSFSSNALALTNSTFKNIVSTSDGFDGKGISGKLTVNMVNEKQNSLVSILNLISDLYKTVKETEKKQSNTNASEAVTF